MKKNFKFYMIGWVVLLGLFNALAFLIPAWPTLQKFTASFWIGWGVAIAAFFGQLICSWVSLKDESAKKTFYGLSMFATSYSGLIGMFVVSMICIVITPLPYWMAAIGCSIVFIANLIAVLKAAMAVSLVTSIDAKVEKATAFIYEMREESETVLARAKTDDVKAICKNVRDAFKYCDPMSNELLAPIEVEIKNHFEAFSKAIYEGNADVATAVSDELLALINERSNKCKRLK